MPSRAQTEAAPVGGRGKFTEKDSAKNSNTPNSGQATPSNKSTPIENAAAINLLAPNLQPMQALPIEPTTSLASPDSVPTSAVSSGPRTASGLAAATEVAKQGVSEGSVGQVQKDSSTQSPATPLDFGLGAAASDAGKPTVVDLPRPLNTAGPVKQFISLPVSEARPPLAPLEESQTGKPEPLSSVVVEACVAKQDFSGLPPSTAADSNAPGQALSPPIADFLGTPNYGDSQPSPSTSTQSGMPLPAMDPASATAGAPTGVRQSASASKPQAGNGDLGNVPAPTSVGMLPHVTDPAGGVKAATRVSQSVLEGNPHSGNSSGQDSVAALPSSVTASRAAFSEEIFKPGLLHAALAMKVGEAVLPADARAKETPTSPAFSNQEETRSKPASSPATPPEANLQTLSSGAVPATPTGQPNGNQLSNTAATANALGQVSLANQDSGSRSVASPASERQSPAEIAPAPLPAAGTIEIARLVASVAQSEMHIGLRTQAFGSVEVHTVVRDSQVGLTVGSERGDLRTLLATEVSALQSTFRQQDLRFDSIRFLETSTGTTAGFSGGADSQPRSSSQELSSTAGFFSIHSPPEDPAELDISAGSRARLNVHA